VIPAATDPPSPGRPGTGTWLFAGLAMLACGLAITARSFWIDECYTALLARQPTLHACWQLLREVKGSDPQMPLYVFWIWSCEKFTGDSEPALRAVNLLWFAPALAALAAAFAGDRRRQAAVFLAAVLSPFAWYYLNEARSYTMQFSMSLILFATLAHWSRDGKKSPGTEPGWALGFALALFCLCGSSLLAMVLAAAPLLLAPAVMPRKQLEELGRNFRPLWLATLGALFLLGLYYLWTLHAGDRGTDVATTGWKNLVFIGYELSGCAGLGPGRLEIRNGGMEVFAAHAAGLITFAVLAASLAGLALADLRGRFGTRRLFAMALAVGIPTGLVLAASAVAHFRILGRHCSALLPVTILLLGLGAAAAWRRGAAGRLLVLAFFSFYLASALSLRFAARHEKDDYRSAAATAKAALAAGKSVWWNADPQATAYYQVPLAKSGVAESGRALWVIHSTAETLAGATPPDMVITSRRDVYDEAGALADFLAREHYRAATNFTAFTIWAH
jgi:hypothetical protein